MEYRTEEPVVMRCKDVELHGFSVRASMWPCTSDLVDVSISQSIYFSSFFHHFSNFGKMS